MTSVNPSNFIVLVVLDGWGLAAEGPGNAIEIANTTNMDRYWASYPHTKLSASGEAVGLPRGEAGNTETGHLNMGAGRIVYQDLERINMAIAEGDFFNNPVFLKAIEHVKQNNSNLHYMGLVGAGGVHSNLSHLFALIRLAAMHDIKNLYIHVFTDGRDSPPTAALTYINRLQEVLKKENTGKIATLMGRYWAMDRDFRWERTKRAYDTLTKGSQIKFDTVEEAIKVSYKNGRTDEFIEPSLITHNGEKPPLISDNDSVIFFNFRVDRPRQLTNAFVLDDFTKAGSKEEFDPYKIKYEKSHIPDEQAHEQPFERERKLNNLFFATMTEYSKNLVEEGANPAFPPEIVNIPLSRVLSDVQKKQLKITESEKERFVTYYFNGLHEKPFDGEDRVIIPSPAVPTYDQRPEMASDKLTDRLLGELKSMKYSFVLVNFPNPDMVGHTGNIGPAVKGIEAVDKCLGRIYNFVTAYNGTMLITADHGNAEEMINNETGKIDTEHSTNMVPFIVINKNYLGNSQMIQSGILADVAPTVLALLGISKPADMTGRNLLEGLN